MPIASDSILLGQLGEISAGQEIPSSYLGTTGDEVKTDFKRLNALGLIADEKTAATPAPTRSEPEPTPAPAPAAAPIPVGDDALPAGVKDLGSGWYEVAGEKIRGRDAAISAAKKD